MQASFYRPHPKDGGRKCFQSVHTWEGYPIPPKVGTPGQCRYPLAKVGTPPAKVGTPPAKVGTLSQVLREQQISQ